MAAKKKTRKTTATPKKTAKAKRPLAALKHLPLVGTYIARENAIIGAYMNSADGKDLEAVLIPCDKDRKPLILTDREYGCFGTDIKGATSWTDDAANTAAMAKEGSKLAQEIQKMGAALPAKLTLAAVFANVKHLFPGDWFWSSTQNGSHGAWAQRFEYGSVCCWGKDCTNEAFPVRRVIASSL